MNTTTFFKGASTAAKILGVAGGLSKLAKMPACNILPLGQQKKTLSGFSQATALPHTGFIYFSTIVQDTPPVSITNSVYESTPKLYLFKISRSWFILGFHVQRVIMEPYYQLSANCFHVSPCFNN